MVECLYRRKSSGTYYALVKRSGKQYRRSLRTTDRKLADRSLADFRRKIDRLDHSKARSELTFAECAKQWLATVTPHMKPSSARRRETNVNQILPNLGAIFGVLGITAADSPSQIVVLLQCFAAALA
ncbi:MAG TPA: hypothetical protein VHD32_13100 [Candidatus Didemnitutus sp.]|nr:hypothetical protein [Candidatus Didemnitutus sp.]